MPLGDLDAVRVPHPEPSLRRFGDLVAATLDRHPVANAELLFLDAEHLVAGWRGAPPRGGAHVVTGNKDPERLHLLLPEVGDEVLVVVEADLASLTWCNRPSAPSRSRHSE